MWVEGRDDSKWLLIEFYGHPDASKRKGVWDMLASFKPENGTSWCVPGDFNEIVCQGENQGGRQRGEEQMDQFRRELERGDLSNLGWMENKFT